MGDRDIAYLVRQLQQGWFLIIRPGVGYLFSHPDPEQASGFFLTPAPAGAVEFVLEHDWAEVVQGYKVVATPALADVTPESLRAAIEHWYIGRFQKGTP